MRNNHFTCKVSIRITCSLCVDTHTYCYENYKWDKGAYFLVPQLPLNWNRVNDYIFCPKHKVEVRNSEDAEREREQRVEAAKLHGPALEKLRERVIAEAELERRRQEQEAEAVTVKLHGSIDSNLEQLLQMIALLKKDRQKNGAIWKAFKDAVLGDRG